MKYRIDIKSEGSVLKYFYYHYIVYMHLLIQKISLRFRLIVRNSFFCAIKISKKILYTFRKNILLYPTYTNDSESMVFVSNSLIFMVHFLLHI